MGTNQERLRIPHDPWIWAGIVPIYVLSVNSLRILSWNILFPNKFPNKHSLAQFLYISLNLIWFILSLFLIFPPLFLFALFLFASWCPVLRQLSEQVKQTKTSLDSSSRNYLASHSEAGKTGIKSTLLGLRQLPPTSTITWISYHEVG